MEPAKLPTVVGADLSVSGVIGFSSVDLYASRELRYGEHNVPFFVTVASFYPADAGSRDQAARWMLDEYIPRYNGTPLTDFDELYPVLRAPLSVARLMNLDIGHDAIEGLIAALPSIDGVSRSSEASRLVQFVEHLYIGEVSMGDTYNVPGQAGAVGRKASAEVHQMIQGPLTLGVEFEALAQELQLILEHATQMELCPEDYAALAAIAEARAASLDPSPDRDSRVLSALRHSGAFALRIAEGASLGVAVAALKRALGL